MSNSTQRITINLKVIIMKIKHTIIIVIVLSFLNVSAQFRLVKDVYPSAGRDSNPRDLFTYNGKLYFSAISIGSFPNYERYIFSSNGTSAGTVMLVSGTNKARITENQSIRKVIHNGNLIVAAIHFDTAGGQSHKLFSIDQTTNAVTLPVNLSPIYRPSGSTFEYAVSLNNKIYFSPQNVSSYNTGVEPFMTDLTQEGTTFLKDIVPYSSSDPFNFSSFPANFTVFNNSLFFSASSTTEGFEIWKSDGTEIGTSLYLDVNTGVTDSNPNQFNVLGNQLIFVAEHPTYGREIFSTDGNGSLTLIKDIYSGTTGSYPTNFKKIGTYLYFSAADTNGQELWRTDGTTEGTVMIKNINPTVSSSPSGFVEFNSEVYFVANDGTHGQELWKTDGTAEGTVMVKDVCTDGSSGTQYLTVYNNRLYFAAKASVNSQDELWVTNGTADGTRILRVNQTAGSYVSNLCVYNGELYFAANGGTNQGIELYAFNDATLANDSFAQTENKIDIYPNPTDSIFTLESQQPIEKVELYSMQGQLIRSFTKQETYDVSDISKGLYFVKISATSGISVKSLVIE